jgi:methylmalonyl-CoA/ethylmalonyl-CoA epimerase
MGVLNRKTADHIGIVVKDVYKTAAQMEAMLGIGPWRINRADDPKIGAKTLVGMAFMENGVEIELIQVLEGPIYHAEFVERVREGIHHLGFATDDVERDTALLAAQGAKIVMHYPSFVSYLRFEGDGGVITELYRTRQPHPTVQAQTD